MSAQTEFYRAIKDSIKYYPERGKDFKKASEWYYDLEYKTRIEALLENESPKVKVNRYINAMVSSARFCFLDFYKKPDRKFEVNGDIWPIKGNPPQYDVVIGDTCYECKCREILDKHYLSLRKNYKKIPELKELIGNRFDKDPIESKDGNDYLFYLRDLKIDLDDDYEKKIHFDVKQFVCHLIGLANSSSYRTLKYVFYCPSDYKKMCLYQELNKEINAIWNSPTIQAFLENHKINLPKPKFIDVGEITDFVYKDGD